MSLWYLSGRPDGPEKVLWWLLQTSRRRLFEVAAVEDELASDEGRIHTTFGSTITFEAGMNTQTLLSTNLIQRLMNHPTSDR